MRGGHLPISGELLPLDDDQEVAGWMRHVAASRADRVVIDLPSHNGLAPTAALTLANLIVVPIVPSFVDLQVAATVLDQLRKIRSTRDGIEPAALLVPSRVDRRSAPGRTIESVLQKMGEMVGPAISLRTTFADSAGSTDWVGRYAPRSAAHQEIAALAAVVAGLTAREPRNGS
jgi:chromosome partitioning protein